MNDECHNVMIFINHRIIEIEFQKDSRTDFGLLARFGNRKIESLQMNDNSRSFHHV